MLSNYTTDEMSADTQTGAGADSLIDTLAPSSSGEWKHGPGDDTSSSSAASLLDTLTSSYEDWKYGHGKNISIVRSTSAIVSLTSSLLLVLIILRSRKRLTTTYHRLLLGISVADVLYSLSNATFGAASPSEISYIVWNAQGSQASCDAFGFLAVWGGGAGLLYSCSLNLYYLAQIKYNKTATYIAKKVEPWLHVVPVLYGLVVGIIIVAAGGINSSMHGVCGPDTYDAPHCIGYEDGEFPEGFDIPCGRGRMGNREAVRIITGLITILIVPIIIGSSLWMIYRSVLEQEQRIARYGAGTLHLNNSRQRNENAATSDIEGGDNGTGTRAEEGGEGGKGILSRMVSAIRSHCGSASRIRPNNQGCPVSRRVLQRATAYSVSYFLTWAWTIVFGIVFLAGAWPSDIPPPIWADAFFYVWNLFNCLQGLWTFLIYMHPRVVERKKSLGGDASWFKAFSGAVWSAVAGAHTDRRTTSSLPATRHTTSSVPATSATAGVSRTA